MKKIFLVLTVVLLIFSCVSCKKEEREILDNVNIEFTDGDSLDFEISVPEDWAIDNTTFENGEIRHYTAPLDDTKDAFAETVNVACEELGEKTTLEKYVDAAINGYKTQSTQDDFKLLSREEVKINGQDAVKISFSYTLRSFKIVNDQIFVMKDNSVYNVFCTSEEEKYDKYAEIFEKALESFKIN